MGLLVAGWAIPLLANRGGDEGVTVIPGDGRAATRGPAANGSPSLDGGAMSGPDGPSPAGQATAPSAAVGPNAGAAIAAVPADSGAPVDLVTDQGVSDGKIRVGFLLYDLGGASRVGFAQTGLDPAQQRRAYEAYVEDVNRRGGIGGLLIEPSFVTFDLLSESEQRQACLALADDQGVYALIGQFFFKSGYGCATVEYERVVIALGSVSAGRDVYDAAGGLLFTAFAEGDRMMGNFAAELERSALLEDRTIGVVSDEGYDPARSTSKVLAATIRELGGTVAHHTHFSADAGVASSQVPLEVRQMQAAGVDTVLLIANPIFSTQFVNQATAQSYPLRYHTTDWAAMATDVGQANMPSSYDGTIGFTTNRYGDVRAGIPETARAAQCRKVYEDYTGEQLTRDTSPYGVALGNCNQVRLFELGARAAGNQLTSAGLSAALQHLGAVEVAQWGGGSFRPGKFRFMDLVRTQRWAYDCRCVIPVDEFRAPRFR